MPLPCIGCEAYYVQLFHCHEEKDKVSHGLTGLQDDQCPCTNEATEQEAQIKMGRQCACVGFTFLCELQLHLDRKPLWCLCNIKRHIVRNVGQGVGAMQ